MDQDIKIQDELNSKPGNFLARVKQELKRAQRYLNFVSYINIDTKNLGLAEEVSEQNHNLEIFTKLRKHIRDSIRQTDLISGFNNGRISLLLIETNKDGVAIVRNRLQESIKYFLHEVVESPMNWKVNIRTGSFPDDEHTPKSFYEKMQSALNK